MSKEPRIITAKDAIEALRHVVARKGPDFVYEKPIGATGCNYVDPNDKKTPSCGVGQALIIDFKVKPAVFFQKAYFGNLLNGLGVGSVMSSFSNPEDIEPGVRISEAACRVFGTFQNRQDSGSPYATALQHAEEVYATLK